VDYFITECRAVFAAQGGLLFSLFLGGLLGSISHCTGMCGPIVMAQASSTDAASSVSSDMTLQRALKGALLPYHFGRATTYMLLGILGAGMSQYLVGTPVQVAAASVMLLVAGLLFIGKAMPSLVPVGAGAIFAPVSKPYGRFVSALAAPFARTKGGGNLYFFGVMLGFLPCGLVMAAVMAVASTGDPLVAAFGMFAFALGTMPSLVFIGTSTSFLRRRYPTEVDRLAKTVMAVNGLLLCALALRLAL